MNKKLAAMILIVTIISGLCIGCGGPTQEQVIEEPELINIIDMAGREVTIPAQVDKVYATSAAGSVFMYTLAPDTLVGWNSPLRDSEMKYIAAEYHNLPDLGRWKGPSYTGSLEDLLEAGPDIILSLGDVSEQYITEAQDIEEQTDIPVIMVDGSLKNTAEAYRFMGQLLAENERAEELAMYCDETFAAIDGWQTDMPEDKKVKVYYAEGIDGLETEISGTVNSEAFDLAGAVNVAVPGVDSMVRRMQVSMEQLLVWDPELIIISSDADSTHEVYNEVLNGAAWADITAVTQGQVYEIPCDPYDWLNRPPSVVRLIGVKWLANLLYPDYYNIDINQDISKFFELFFDYQINQSEVEPLLSRSQRK